MLSVFLYSFQAVAPIILLILAGCLVRRLHLLDAKALKQLNKFNFRFPFCALMFVNLYDADVSTGIPWRLAVCVLGILVLMTVLGIALSNVITKERFRKGVLVQALFRSNYAIIGLALVEGMVGGEGRAVAAMLQLPTVFYFNLTSVILLSIYSDSKEPVNFRRALVGIAKNPLIQGLLAGALALLIRRVIPLDAAGVPVFSLKGTLPWLYDAISSLSKMATPMALIVLGAQLEVKEAAAFRRELVSGVLLRLVAAPVIGFGLIILAVNSGFLALSRAETAMLVAVFGSPLAVSSVVMAQEMNADDKLAGQIVVWTSILGMFSLFVIVFILRMSGWL